MRRAIKRRLRGSWRLDRRLHEAAETTDEAVHGIDVMVARELMALIRIYGKPDCIVSDNVLYAERLADLASGYCRVEASQHVRTMARFGVLVNER